MPGVMLTPYLVLEASDAWSLVTLYCRPMMPGVILTPYLVCGPVMPGVVLTLYLVLRASDVWSRVHSLPGIASQ